MSITLRYLHPDLQQAEQPIDVVNLTVLGADLDIVGVSDGEEEYPGGLLVRRHDGNQAPRQEIVIGPVLPAEPEAWEGDLLLQRFNSKIKVFDADEEGTEINFDGADNLFSNADLLTVAQHLWVQGDVASCAMYNTGLTLTPQGMNGGADAVKFTVADITDVAVHQSDQETAEIPSVLGRAGWSTS